MNAEVFESLDHDQRVAMLLAIHIRNDLEECHEFISDAFMPTLNSTIRYAIYDFYKNVLDDSDKLYWLSIMIPRYWEIPGRDPKPTFQNEFLFDGKPISLDPPKGKE